MDNPKTLTVLSLCAGYGGLELGLSRALANPLRVVAVEIEAYALGNLEAKASQGLLAIEALWPDLKTFPAERFRGCFDIVTAGYPCQPFSCAGQRNGESDPRHLFPHIAEIVRAVQPVWCFFENVGGHLSLGFPSVYRSLRDLGYSVEAGLFNASDPEVGAPHKRQRLFILAHASGKHRREEYKSEPGRECVLRPERIAAEAMQERRLGEFGSKSSRRHGLYDLWPAPPGRPQHEWEEPRVVGVGDGGRRQGEPEQNIRSETEQQAPRRGNPDRSDPDAVADPARLLRPGGGKKGSELVGDTGTSRTRTTQSSGRQEYNIQKQRKEVAGCEPDRSGKGQAQSPMGVSVDGRPGGVVRHRVDQLRLLGNGCVPAQVERAFRTLMSQMEDGL